MNQKKKITDRLAWLYVVGGSIGLLASFIITLEKLTLVADPSYIPPCDISPFVSCGPIMLSPQASAFGFPNSLLGIVGFAVVAAIGVALLAGASFKKWFWIGAKVGLSLALAFVYWLFYQAVFVIGALCVYCMVVWAVTIPLFAYSLFKKPLIPLALLYGVIVVAILQRFWIYWVTLF